MSNRDMEIARTIKQQLGAGFATMTGAHSFSATTNGLVFKLPRAKSYMTIVLNGADLYDVTLMKQGRFSTNRKTFESVWHEPKELGKRTDVYCDGLHEAFEALTGVYATL